MWRCDECHWREVFVDQNALDQHMADVHNIFWYCKHCSEKFRLRIKLDSHENQEHAECELCGIRCRDPVAVAEHVAENHPTCAHCPKMFGSRNALNHHMKIHVLAKSAPSRDTTLSVRSLVRSAVAAHQCEQCNAKFDAHQDLEKHIREGHQIRCMHCPSLSETIAAYEDHLRKEHNLRCSECSATFISTDQRLDHQWDQHHFTCIHCPDWFISSDLLKVHVANLHQYSCEISGCGAGIFVTSASLQNHKSQAHSIKCDICSTYFKTAKFYDKHMSETHSHKCDTATCASGTFTTLTALAEHNKLTHALPCEKCPKKLTTFTLYLEHMQDSHSHFCMQCPGATFDSAQALRNHYWASHRTTESRCFKCAERFSNDEKLYNHILHVHARDHNKQNIGDIIDFDLLSWVFSNLIEKVVYGIVCLREELVSGCKKGSKLP